jgi:mannose-6-phosphate isomerase-like protein (cupin superfamily)
MSDAPFRFATHVVQLDDGGASHAVEMGGDFWATIGDRSEFGRGRLMGVVAQSKDWDHWERHPHGEEILVLLSGEIEMVLETAEGERRATLQAGQAFVVPRGLWHRGIVRQAGELMFVTPGVGTEHRPVA